MFTQIPRDDGRVRSWGARPLGGTTLGSGKVRKTIKTTGSLEKLLVLFLPTPPNVKIGIIVENK